MTVTTPTTDFVPDEELLWFIDELPLDVIKWSPREGSTEFNPLITLEIGYWQPLPEYIMVNFSLPDADGS